MLKPDSLVRDAILSDDGVYRYLLTRRWGTTGSTATFVMLNPSTADALTDDATIRRCIGFARSWGYDGLAVANLFALRSTDPKALARHPNPVGPDNDVVLAEVARESDRIVVAWGAHAFAVPRAREVVELLTGLDVSLWALASTKDGHPVHPLRQPGSLWPTPWALR